jgi:hypothetical protein
VKKAIIIFSLLPLLGGCAPLLVGAVTGATVGYIVSHQRPGWCYYHRHYRRIWFRC